MGGPYISPVKTWIAGEVLTASDLNTEFLNTLASQIPEPAGSVHGDILFLGDTAWKRLPAGTSGYFLKTKGYGSDPEWASALINPMTAAGDLMYGGVSGVATRFPIGTAGQLLAVNAGATAPEWVTASTTLVTKALFDANTILAANTDNTPAALTISEQRIVGRITSGNITGLTATQVRTLVNVEDGATADQTGAEIKALYEAEADTNAYTDAEKSKLSGIEATADVTDAANVEDAITGASEESDPEDADLFPTVVSATLKKLTWANIKATLKTYFDTVYAAITHATTHKSGGSDILYVPRTYIWFIPGTVTADTEQGPTYKMKRATTVEDVELHVQTAPTGASLIVDINEAGTTIFSTKPEIDAGSTTEDDNHVISDSSLAAGAELTMDIDQIGSTVAGSDLTVRLHVKEAVI